MRWTSRAGATTELSVSADVRGGLGKVVVEAIDDKGRLLNFLDLAGHSVDPRHEGQSFALVQTAPGRYEGEFEAGPPGSYSVNVTYKDANGQIRHHTVGTACGYSPEFAQTEANPGLLAEIAKATGGRMLTGDAAKDRKSIWERNLPVGYRSHPGWKWLLWLALALFPLDVALRRVMIDWREVRRVLQVLAAMLFPRLRPALAGAPDPTMAALKAEKERIRQAAPPPAGEDVRSRFVEQLTKARAEEEARFQPGPALDRRLPAAGSRLSEAPKTDSQKPKTAPATGISNYTAALLEAKKRALKERQASAGEDQKKDEPRKG